MTLDAARQYDGAMQIYVDGKLVLREDAKVSVFDHGLLYGDGVFEGIRVYNRRIFRLEAHLDRLYTSARALALEIPLSPDRKSTRLNSSHIQKSRMPSSA